MLQNNARDEYERFVSFENFQLAWQRVRNSTRFEVKDRLSLRVFSTGIDVHLHTLIDDILEQRYQPSKPPFIYVPKKAGTLRPFPFINMRDRLVYQALGNIIIENAEQALEKYADIRLFSPVLNSVSSPFLFKSSHPNFREKGQFAKFYEAVQAAKTNSDYLYVARADIAAFYPSVDHALLIDCLQRHEWLIDDVLQSLLSNCLFTWSSPDESRKFRQGVPIGYETSDILGALFLHEIDEDSENYCYMVRYVDDMYVFASNKEKIEFALSRIDLQLQLRALNLQTEKISIAINSGPDPESKTHSKFRFHADLSIIDFQMLGGTVNGIQDAQHKLLNLLQKVIMSVEENEDDANTIYDYLDFSASDFKRLREYDSTVAFILYRLKDKREDLKVLALKLLDELPTRSFHVTQYLSLFEQDPEVLNVLLNKAKNPLAFAHLRANCLKRLAKMTNFSEETLEVARSWCNQTADWLLRVTAIEILQYHSNEAPFLRNAINNENEDHVRASMISAYFNLIGFDNKADIIRIALSDDSYLVKSLGIHLWLQNPDLVQLQRSEINQYSQVVQTLIESTGLFQAESTAIFRNELLRLYKFDINSRLDLLALFEENFEDVRKILSIAFYSKETAANGFVDAIAQFTSYLASATVNTLGVNLQTLLPPNLVNQINDLARTVTRLPFFEGNASIFGDTIQAMKIRQIDSLLDNLSRAYAVVFIEFHRHQQLEPPDSLNEGAKGFTANHVPQDKLLLEKDINRQLEIFLSYAHKDDELKHNLRNHLRIIELNGWAKIWHDREIPAGGSVHEIIDQHINTAEIILLLISSDFFGSQYIIEIELPIALRRNKHEECITVPVIMRNYLWKEHKDISALKALPKDGKAVTSWPDQDEAYMDIAEAVVKLVKNYGKA